MPSDLQIPGTLQSSDPQQELMAFFNAMDEVFFSFDFVHRRLTKISTSCEKIFGYKAASFLADNHLWFQLVHPGDKPITVNEYKTLKLGQYVHTQHRAIRSDGAICWVEKKIVPVLDKDGTLLRVDGVIRDVTGRWEDDIKKRKSESLYRQIVKSAQEGIWTIDEQDRTNFVNQAMCRMLGYTSQEMMGKQLYDFMDAEGQAIARVCMERRKQGARENLELRYVTKAGHDLWAYISANPILDENGKYRGALAMVTDITQRRAHEEALKQSAANLRTVFDNTDSAYILIDAEHKIVSFNALAQKYSEEQNDKSLVANSLMQEYFRPERWPLIQQMLARVAAGELVNYELNLTDKNGNTKWYEVRWLNVKNNDNKNWGFILVNKDITEAKIATLEREKIAADLVQHTKHLEQFTYIVSHNLRAPVANIIGLSDLLKDDDIDNEMRHEVVEKVSHSIKNIDDVIKDLNQILQARKTVNEQKEKVYFKDVCDAIQASIHNTLVNENAEFHCSFDVESIFTIRSYLYSIFYNLTSNSIKYRQPGVMPLIHIKTQTVGNRAELVFTDNGKGIDMDKNGEQIFGLYKRFDSTTEGKGMGLFMVKTQVEALGGTIDIKSEVGKGTRFTIQLPL